MWRHLLAMAVMVVGGLAVGQEKQPSAAEQKESERKRTEAYLKKHPTEIPELAALAEDSSKRLADLAAAVKVSDDDKPAVRAAKRSLLAENERRKLIEKRITLGQFTNSNAYSQLYDTAFNFYQSAVLIWSEPEKLLPFAECAAAELFKSEMINKSRVDNGLEVPELMPQLRAARHKAEMTVLKLREQVKKK